MNEIQYYLILNRLIGKEESGSYYLLKDGKWILDEQNVIRDRLFGYDPDEPPGSPYGIGCSSVMDEIEEISYEEAKSIAGGCI